TNRTASVPAKAHRRLSWRTVEMRARRASARFQTPTSVPTRLRSSAQARMRAGGRARRHREANCARSSVAFDAEQLLDHVIGHTHDLRRRLIAALDQNELTELIGEIDVRSLAHLAFHFAGITCVRRNNPEPLVARKGVKTAVERGEIVGVGEISQRDRTKRL